MREQCQRLPSRRASLFASLLSLGVVLWSTTGPGQALQQVPGRVESEADPSPARVRMRLSTPGRSSGGGFAFSPDGAILAIIGPRTHLWDFAKGKQLRELCPKPNAFAPYRNSIFFSHDGRTLLAASSDRSLALWDMATGKQIRTIYATEAGKVIWSFMVSPDEKQLIVETGRTEGVKGKNDSLINQLQLLDLAQGKLVRSFQRAKSYKRTGDGGYFGRLAIAPDGKTVAAADQSGTIVLWDVATGKIRREILAPNWRWSISSLAFSIDSRSLLSSDCRGVGGVGMMSWTKDQLLELSLRIRDVATGKERFSIPGMVGSFALSPDGRTVAMDGRDDFCLIELLTGQKVLRFAVKDNPITLAFSPNCQTLAATLYRAYNDYVLIWDLIPTDWRPSTAPLSASKLLALWDSLSGHDASAAYRSVLTLSAHPKQTIPFLKARLAPIPAERPERIRQLVADLDDDAFIRRESASKELARLGPQAESALRETLAGSPSIELRSRAEPLLKALDTWVVKDPQTLQNVRAIWVLQRIGTPEARALLENLAAGTPDARQTQEAKATLQFLDHIKIKKR